MDNRPFLGRAPELGALDELLDALDRGRGGVLVVEGELGVGKTALLRAAATRSGKRGHHVLSVAGSSYESGLRHQLVQRLLGGLDTGPASAPDVVCRHAHADLAERARQRPVLLVVDDAQWCDAPSLACLGFVARRVDTQPIGMVIARCSGQPSTDPVAAEELDHATRSVWRLNLSTHDPDVTHGIITHLLGELNPDTRAELVAWTMGNPKLLVEIAEVLARHREDSPAVRDIVPASVHTWLRGRAAHGLRVATALAVLGEGAELDLLAELTGRSTVETERTLRELVELGLLRRGRPVSFRHPVVRAALLDTVPVADRARMCVAGARRLRRMGANDQELVDHVLASQVVDHPCTTDLLMASVRRRAEALPVPERAEMLRRVLGQHLSDAARAEVLHLLGLAELDLDPRAADLHLAEGYELAGQADWRATIAVDRMRAGQLLGRDGTGGDWTGRDGTGRDGTGRDGAGRDETGRDETGRDGAGRGWARTERHAEQCLLLTATAAATRPGGFAAAVHRNGAVGQVLAALAGRTPVLAPDEVWRLLRPAHSDGAPLTWLLMQRAVDDPDRLVPYAEAWGRDAHQGPLRRALAHVALAEMRLRQAVLSAAHQQVRQLVELLPTVHATAPALLPVVLPVVLTVLVERDELGTARRLCVQHAADPPGNGWHEVVLRCARGHLRLATNDPTGALDDLRSCGDHSGQWRDRAPHALDWRTGAVAAHLALGQRSAARGLAEEELFLAREHDDGRRLGRALSSAGATDGGAGGLARLEESVALLEENGTPLDLARACGQWGAGLAQRGRRKAARDRLRRACALAEESGAWHLRRTLGVQLAEAGGRVHGQLRGAPALTDSERRVVGLVLEGGTNARIAERLFITRRAVEMHLTQVYRKLGIAGRAELATVLATADDTG